MNQELAPDGHMFGTYTTTLPDNFWTPTHVGSTQTSHAHVGPAVCVFAPDRRSRWMYYGHGHG
jgi:hypothetical protein